MHIFACIIQEIDRCTNNLQHSPKTKVSEHIALGLSMSTMSSFRRIENEHDVYKSNDCMIKFCEYLREHAMKIINFKKKKMKLLTMEQQESHANANL